MSRKQIGTTEYQTSAADTIAAKLAAQPADEVKNETATIDPYHGHGGSFVLDEATQTRQPNPTE